MARAVENPFMMALGQFDATESNLVKLERTWKRLQELTPSGIVFGEDAEYEDCCRRFQVVLAGLPKIDGWKPQAMPLDLNDVAQGRLDAREVDEPHCYAAVEDSIKAPGRELREYRFKLEMKRRELTRHSLPNLIQLIDSCIIAIRESCAVESDLDCAMQGPKWELLQTYFDQVATLLGSGVTHLSRWTDLQRHLRFGLVKDFLDIEQHDWPLVKTGFTEIAYGLDDPIPVQVDDLSQLTGSNPRGPIVTKLHWERLSADQFERLIFTVLSSADGYENPMWLMKTTAPDRGRDLSVTRATVDALIGTTRSRIIVQCKHWLQKTVSLSDISVLREQMMLWEPPKVDICLIVTSGRFSSDAVALVERHNLGDSGMRIEMWPESAIERMLASRPAIIAEFGLR